MFARGVNRSIIQERSSSRDLRRLFISCLTLVVLASTTINVLLAREITSLKAAISHLKGELGDGQHAEAGQSLPRIEVINREGDRITIESILSVKPTVIYVFAPSCRWCARNAENVRVLAESIKDRFQTVGLSLTDDGLDEFVGRTVPGFPVFRTVPASNGLLGRATPRTIVVSSEGKIISTWFGAYSGTLRREIEEYFRLSLPGLLSDEHNLQDSDRKTCE